MSYTKKNALIFAAIIVSIFAFSIILTFKDYPFNLKRVEIKINEATIKTELTRTDEQKSRGLSGRNSLEEDGGMLFVFDEPGYHGFWMKDMNFSLDIVWINEELVIVDITQNIPSESYPQIFRPKEAAKYVLEVNAGWTERHNVTVGDKIDIN